jgi:hypothetical protein
VIVTPEQSVAAVSILRRPYHNNMVIRSTLMREKDHWPRSIHGGCGGQAVFVAVQGVRVFRRESIPFSPCLLTLRTGSPGRVAPGVTDTPVRRLAVGVVDAASTLLPAQPLDAQQRCRVR